MMMMIIIIFFYSFIRHKFYTLKLKAQHAHYIWILDNSKNKKNTIQTSKEGKY